MKVVTLWGLYRNTRLNMGDILRKGANWQAALVTYLEVAYLDLNEPNNIGDDTELQEWWPELPLRLKR